MIHIKLDNEGKIKTYPYLLSNFQAEFPDKKVYSMQEVPTTFLEENNIYPVQTVPVPELTFDQRPVMGKPIEFNGKWVQQWEIKTLTPEELERKEFNLNLNLRKHRGKLLTESDWVVTKSVELGTPIPDEWLQYRQALRDLPTQPGFPHMVQFPKSPDTSLNSLPVPPTTTIEE
jgi:hypothetical protein